MLTRVTGMHGSKINQKIVKIRNHNLYKKSKGLLRSKQFQNSIFHHSLMPDFASEHVIPA